MKSTFISLFMVLVFSPAAAGQLPHGDLEGKLNTGKGCADLADKVVAWNSTLKDSRTQTIVRGSFVFLNLPIPSDKQPWELLVATPRFRFNSTVLVPLKQNETTSARPKPLCVVQAKSWFRSSDLRLAASGRAAAASVLLPVQAETADVTRGLTIAVEQPDSGQWSPAFYYVEPGGRLVEFKPQLKRTAEGIETRWSSLSQGERSVLVAIRRKGYQTASALIEPSQVSVRLKLEPRMDTPDATGLSGNAVRGGLFEPLEIDLLPIGGTRSVDSLALLLPGVTPPPKAGSGTGPGISPTLGTAGEVVINGISPRLNNFTVDGTDNNDEDAGVRRKGFIFPTPYTLESIRQFSVLTALYDMRYGRAAGGHLNVLTRSGTGQLHGTVYGYLSSDALNARDYFNASSSRRDANRNGATGFYLDLPTRSTTFWAIGGEYRDIDAAQTIHFAVPDLADRGFLRTGGRTYMGAAPSSFVGNAVFGLFPLPNNPDGPYAGRTYTTQSPAGGHGVLYSTRLDQSLPRIPFSPASWRHRLYVSGSGATESSTLPETGGSLYSSLQPNVHNYTGSVILSSNAGPSAANSFRASFGEAFYQFRTARDALLPAPAAISPVGRVVVAGYSPIGIDVFRFPQTRKDQTWQLSEMVTFLPTPSKRTTIRAGIDFWRYRFSNNANPNALPLLQFNGARNGTQAPYSAADIVAAGFPSLYQQTLVTDPNTDLNLYRSQVDLFIGADHHFGSNLTVNFGVRLEFNGLPFSRDGRFESSFYRSTLAPATSQDRCFESSILCSELLRNLKAAFPADFISVFAANRKTFDPRLGFAWSPNHLLVVRGGLGRYTAQFPSSILSESRSIFPNSLTLSEAGATRFELEIPPRNGVFLGPIPTVFPGFGKFSNFVTSGNLLLADFARDPLGFLTNFAQQFLISQHPAGELRNPYALQYHLTMESAVSRFGILSIGYVGTQSRHLLRQLEYGAAGYTASLRDTGRPVSEFRGSPSPATSLCLVDQRFQYCGGVAKRLLETGGRASYHSLQLALRQHFVSAGLQLGASLTYAHTIDTVSDLFDTAGQFAVPQDSTRADLERASSAFDTRIRVPVFFDWVPPLRRGHALLHNWHVAGIVTAQTGMPYTVNTVYDVNISGTLNGRLATSNGLQLGPVGGDRRVSIGAVDDPRPYLPSGNGIVGRNTFRANGLNTVDLSLGRSFPIGDTKEIRLRLEGLNLFNSPQFGIPVRLLGAPGFGTSVTTAAPNRRLQLNLRFSF